MPVAGQFWLNWVRSWIQAPAGAETHLRYDFVTADWARTWPSEEIWRARKR